MKTTYYKRYINNEELAVWDELKELNNITPEHPDWGDITDVLKETMWRVKFNINTIYERLKVTGYEFNEKHPCKLPCNETNNKIKKLSNAVKPFGYIPLSLEFFYFTVGSVDFTPLWDKKILHEYSDPLCIASVDEAIELMGEDGEWEENMEDFTSEGHKPYIDIAPDFYHKDNVSGGSPYGIEVTNTKQVDSMFLNTPYNENLFFIDYLRLCFEWGGFPNISEYNDNYQSFIDNLKTGLKTI